MLATRIYATVACHRRGAHDHFCCSHTDSKRSAIALWSFRKAFLCPYGCVINGRRVSVPVCVCALCRFCLDTKQSMHHIYQIKQCQSGCNAIVRLHSTGTFNFDFFFFVPCWPDSRSVGRSSFVRYFYGNGEHFAYVRVVMRCRWCLPLLHPHFAYGFGASNTTDRSVQHVRKINGNT